MKREEINEALLFWGLSVFLAFACFLCANLFIPKNCELFSSNGIPHDVCHTIPSEPNCMDAYCKDQTTAMAATIIAGFGILLIITPILIYPFQDWQRRKTIFEKIT
jgi:hypothetical protein